MKKVAYFQFQSFYRILDWEGFTILKCAAHFLKNQPIFENPINIETDSGMIVAFLHVYGTTHYDSPGDYIHVWH